MDKSPASRYQSYDEFIMALTAARSELLRSQLAPLSSSKPRRAKPAAAKEAAPARGWFRRGK
jgi:hypothetical protein